MTKSQIRARVDELYSLIEDSLDPSDFILNPKVKVYSDEIEELRNQCLHEFKNGVCIYCDKIEK